MSRYPSSTSHLDTVNQEAFRRHFEYWRYWNPDFHLPKRCSGRHLVNKKLNLDCMFEAWFQIWIPNTQSRLRVQKHCFTLWIYLNLHCLFEAWFHKYRINRGFVFKIVASLCEWNSKALLHFVNKKLNLDCVFEVWFCIEYQILNQGFVFKSFASLCEYN